MESRQIGSVGGSAHGRGRWKGGEGDVTTHAHARGGSKHGARGEIRIIAKGEGDGLGEESRGVWRGWRVSVYIIIKDKSRRPYY